MDTQALAGLGLTDAEIKIYVALLELGQSGAGEILRKANVQNSVFHACINRLLDKGFVSYTKKNRNKIYCAADPSQFVHYLKEKQRAIEDIMPDLKKRQALAKKHDDAEIYEGIAGIMTMLNTMLENAKRDDEFLFISADVLEHNEEIQTFYERYDAKRKDKGLTTKGIAPRSLQHLYHHRKYLKVKYTEMPLPTNACICGELYAIITWDQPVGILIHSKHIVEKERAFFNAIWAEAKVK